MTTLDDYLRPEYPASKSNPIRITVTVATGSRRHPNAFKLKTLEKVIRELQAHGRRSSVDSIYYDLLLLDIVESREELANLLRLAERKGRIQQRPHSVWTAEACFAGEKRKSDDSSISCYFHGRR